MDGCAKTANGNGGVVPGKAPGVAGAAPAEARGGAGAADVPLHWMDWRNDLHLLTDLLPERARAFSVDRWAASLGGNPCRNTLALLGLATLLFYKAEKERNPKVNDIWDALEFCSTNLSVGYSDIFAKTPVGKLIASALMTFGPPMAAHLLDGRDRDETGPSAVQRQMLAALKDILTELRKATPENPGASGAAGHATDAPGVKK